MEWRSLHAFQHCYGMLSLRDSHPATRSNALCAVVMRSHVPWLHPSGDHRRDMGNTLSMPHFCKLVEAQGLFCSGKELGSRINRIGNAIGSSFSMGHQFQVNPGSVAIKSGYHMMAV